MTFDITRVEVHGCLDLRLNFYTVAPVHILLPYDQYLPQKQLNWFLMYLINILEF